jgi:serine/threonine-protein kinase
MHDSSADREPIERLAEEFIARHRRGERPPLTEYVARSPDLASEIRELFPALLMMERLKPAVDDGTRSFIGGGRAETNGMPERLGDFRILREVGRGGMGIVYEAVQESLGRHVALKVLPSHALINPRHLNRFHREARAAACLHHTNIVPVFGVGEGEGLHYYVMQFIAGSALNEVIDELRRLKSPDGTTAQDGVRSASFQRASAVARALLSGNLVTTSMAGQAQVCSGSSTTTNADPHTTNSILKSSTTGFAREVARMGLQVAQALGYAHAQGVLHRDIKPSNLLLDVQGTVWVTDFGLAKALAEGDDLTHEGDLLGTLRYMAPERFRGEADARSDLYALGLTLYEQLTLRPAFDQNDRDRLIHQVTTGVPPRPRTLNREIPRDLETIVLKAIEHDPARRYQSANELADDLQRFLADRPIQARAVGGLERAWKWARRRPAVAGLLTALCLAVVLGFSGITWEWREAVVASRAATHNAEEARQNLDHAMQTVQTFCTQVSQEELLDQPGMLELRRRLLDQALQYYQTFQRKQSAAAGIRRRDDPRMARELANSFMNVGIIRNEFGESTKAIQALERAKDLFKELIRGNPRDLKLTEEFARCCIEYEDAERLNDIEFRFMQELRQSSSVQLAESLIAADPDNREYLRLLGRSHDMSGLRWLRWRTDSYTAAQAEFEKAIAALRRVYRTAPDETESARRLAQAQAHLGLVQHLDGRHSEAIDALKQALDILKPVVERFPKSRRFRLDHAETLVNLGRSELALGRYAESHASFVEAERRLIELGRDDAQTIDARYMLAAAKHGLGRVALARGQLAASGRSQRDAIALYGEIRPESRGGRDVILLASTYLWLGRARRRSRCESAGDSSDACRVACCLEGYARVRLHSSSTDRRPQDFDRRI